jgi:hypothetical protein
LCCSEGRMIVSESGSRSWQDAVDGLRKAATEVRSALGRSGEPSAAEDAAASRLKSDVSRLEESATDLLGKLSNGLTQQRTELESSFDRERAEASSEQIKRSLEELASVAARLTSDVAAAAGSTVKQAEPELRSAVRALEDVAGSTASWVRAVIDPPRGERRETPAEARPPLDDL